MLMEFLRAIYAHFYIPFITEANPCPAAAADSQTTTTRIHGNDISSVISFFRPNQDLKTKTVFPLIEKLGGIDWNDWFDDVPYSIVIDVLSYCDLLLFHFAAAEFGTLREVLSSLIFIRIIFYKSLMNKFNLSEQLSNKISDELLEKNLGILEGTLVEHAKRLSIDETRDIIVQFQNIESEFEKNTTQQRCAFAFKYGLFKEFKEQYDTLTNPNSVIYEACLKIIGDEFAKCRKYTVEKCNLLFCVKKDYTDIAKFLIEKTFHRDYFRNGLAIFELLYEASRNGNMELVENIIYHIRTHFTLGENMNSRQLLGYAVRGGNLKLLQYLISLIDDDDVRDVSDICIGAMMSACGSGNVEVVNYLVDKFSLNHEYTLRNSKTPLHYAFSNNRIDILSYFIKKFDIKNNINAKKDYIEALESAASNGSLDVIKFVNEKLDLVAVDFRYSNNIILRSAFEYGHFPVVNFLLEVIGLTLEDVRAKDNQILECECRKGNLFSITYLIDKVGIELRDVEYDNCRCLATAAGYGHKKLIMYLVRRFALNKKHFVVNDAKVMMYAINFGQEEIVMYIFEEFKITLADLPRNQISLFTTLIIKNNLNMFKIVQVRLRITRHNYPKLYSEIVNVAERFGAEEILNWLEKDSLRHIEFIPVEEAMLGVLVG